MAKQRASIRGRGAEILFGGPEEVEIQPREPAEAAAGPAPPESSETPPDATEEAASEVAEEVEEESPLDEAEIEAALQREASDGAPPPEGEEAPPALLDEPPPVTPEMEQAFIEEAYAAEVPPDPVAETPAPTMEVTMQEETREQEDALFQAPPPEVEDVSSGVLPPQPSPTFMDLHFEPAAAEARDIQEMENAVKPIELDERQLTEEERKAILAWYRKKAQEMEESIAKTYDEIRRKVAENESVTNQAYNNLLKARDILLRRDAARIPQAEYYIEQTQALLARVTVSESAAKKYQWRILGWGVFWSVFFLAALILLGQQWFVDIVAPSASNGGTGVVDMEVFIASMVWGGIGGAVAILYSLFKHVGARNFDPEYKISYIGKPFLGVIIGATAYMVLNLLIRVLGIFPAGLEGVEGATSPTVAPGVTYLVAWASGFKEDRILDLVDRAMKQIFGEEKAETTPEPSPTPPAT